MEEVHSVPPPDASLVEDNCGCCLLETSHAITFLRQVHSGLLSGVLVLAGGTVLLDMHATAAR